VERHAGSLAGTDEELEGGVGVGVVALGLLMAGHGLAADAAFTTGQVLAARTRRPCASGSGRVALAETTTRHRDDVSMLPF
jgi:hypothetical protein